LTVLGFEVKGLVLAWQVLYHLSRAPSPKEFSRKLDLFKDLEEWVIPCLQVRLYKGTTDKVIGFITRSDLRYDWVFLVLEKNGRHRYDHLNSVL
jgi:hypothetical protein